MHAGGASMHATATGARPIPARAVTDTRHSTLDTHRARAGRGRRPLVALAAALALASPLAAQPARVLLKIQPRTGDTLRMRLDQTVEMSGTTRVGAADSTMTVSSTMQVLSRAVVEQSGARGTQVLAITDSVFFSPALNPKAVDAAAALRGQRVRMHVAPDGAMSVADDGRRATSDVRHLFAQMPASLPREPVAVGATWTRAMPLPEAADGGKHAGTLQVQYRLDSLSRNGELAYISMRGSLSRDGAAPKARRGTRVATIGTVTGDMLVDRRRGWMTDSRVTVSLRTVVTPPVEREPRSGANPMRIRLKITQWLRAM
jgi:hypothetical protein